jgi:DNA-binding transcriptional MerR regulator
MRDDDFQITLNEAARRTGVGVSTLWRWIAVGLIDKPTVGLHESGNGRVGRWPGNMLARIRRIRTLQISGMTLAQIRLLFKQETTGAPATENISTTTQSAAV